MNVTTEIVTEKRYHVVLSENEAKILRLADTMAQDAGNEQGWATVRRTLSDLDKELDAVGCPYDWYAPNDAELPF